MTYIRTLAIVLALGVSLAAQGNGKGHKPKPPPLPPPSPIVSLDCAAWQIRFSIGLPLHPACLQSLAGWFLNVPQIAANDMSLGSVHYVTVPYTASLSGKSAVTMTGQIVTDPATVFVSGPSTCDVAPNVHLYIEANFTSEFGRWWSNPQSVLLAPGVFTITVPLTGDQWSSVFGQFGSAAPSGFASALSKPTNVGMTWGGGCFFGHGVAVMDGSAQFILTNYAVQP